MDGPARKQDPKPVLTQHKRGVLAAGRDSHIRFCPPDARAELRKHTQSDPELSACRASREARRATRHSGPGSWVTGRTWDPHPGLECTSGAPRSRPERGLNGGGSMVLVAAGRPLSGLEAPSDPPPPVQDHQAPGRSHDPALPGPGKEWEPRPSRDTLGSLLPHRVPWTVSTDRDVRKCPAPHEAAEGRPSKGRVHTRGYTHACSLAHTNTYTHTLVLTLAPTPDGSPGSLLPPAHLEARCQTSVWAEPGPRSPASQPSPPPPLPSSQLPGACTRLSEGRATSTSSEQRPAGGGALRVLFWVVSTSLKNKNTRERDRP